MAHKEYMQLPDDCATFTMESFDKLQGFKIVVLNENPDITDPYLCIACRESDCPTRRSDSRDVPELTAPRMV